MLTCVAKYVCVFCESDMRKNSVVIELNCFFLFAKMLYLSKFLWRRNIIEKIVAGWLAAHECERKYRNNKKNCFMNMLECSRCFFVVASTLSLKLKYMVDNKIFFFLMQITTDEMFPRFLSCVFK